jgi:hypothetical protein
VNADRIRSALANIEEARLALRWIRFSGAVEPREWSVEVSSPIGVGVNGYRQAMRSIAGHLRHDVNDAREAAERGCINTIRMEADAIREELEKAAEVEL